MKFKINIVRTVTYSYDIEREANTKKRAKKLVEEELKQVPWCSGDIIDENEKWTIVKVQV